MAGTVVAPGETVKLQCVSKINHDVFILTKEDGDHVTQNQSSVPHDGGRQTIFLLNPVSSTQAGTYRCYGAFREYPYVWSQPSDPLQLQVEGTTDSPSSTQPRHSTAPSGNRASQDIRLGIWIGVPVAVGLLLLVFLIFLILYCLRKAKNSRFLTAGGGACAEIPGTQIPLGKWGGALAGGGGGAEGSRSNKGWAVLLVHAVTVVTAFQTTGLEGIDSHPPENMTLSLLCSRDCCCCCCCVAFHYQR
uniref:Leukocyte immunoglobulin-like receptor subfamily A member 6 n=1 Tax=Bos indicus x Bos taurus TaxID=30522 RepID=A0A4W2GK01_BOBOX